MGVGRAQAPGFGSNIWARQCKASAAAASAGQSCNAEATKASLSGIREVMPCVPGRGATWHATAMLLRHHEHIVHIITHEFVISCALSQSNSLFSPGRL